MKHLRTFEGFSEIDGGGLKPESSDNLDTIRQILLSMRDEEVCKFDDNTENFIYAIIDDESVFNELKERLDSFGFSYAVSKPRDNSDWVKKNFQHDPDVLETTKWRVLVWDDVIEGVFKSWLDRAKYKLDDETGTHDMLCEQPGNRKSWLFRMTSKSGWGKTNFLDISADLWDNEMRERFGLEHNTMNMLMKNLCLKYLIPGQDPKNWIVTFAYKW